MKGLRSVRGLLSACNTTGTRCFHVASPLLASKPFAPRSFERQENDRPNRTFRGNNQRGPRGGFNDRSGGFNNNRAFGRGGPPKGNRRGPQSEDFDHMRNRVSTTGKEGDGLMGLDDYPVLNDLDDLHWKALVIDESSVGGDKIDASESDAEAVAKKFSGAPTSSLADKRIVSRVLVNSLLHGRDYKYLTDVQAQTVIPLMRGESAIVRAKTGTGKTAAFSIPSIEKVLQLKKKGIKGVKALIISPTRELAQQISDEISKITAFGEMRTIKTVCMVGGLSKFQQLKEAFGGRDKADIIVGTPGRLNDVLNEDEIAERYFSNMTIKVLDEADRLLDQGFAGELSNIDSTLKQYHSGEFQTLLFSATTDRNVTNFAHDELNGKVNVIDTVPENEPGAQELVHQTAVQCQDWAEIYMAALQYIQQAVETRDSKPVKAVVFCPTVALCDHFGELLSAYLRQKDPEFGARVFTVHGQISQAKRQRRADSFRKEKNGFLVTTDVVARGMDFPNVTHVFQLGVPGELASYVHRIGRTARIGNSGKSFMFHTKHESSYLKLLERQKIKMNEYDTFESSKDLEEDVSALMPTLRGEVEPQDAYISMFASYGPVKKLLKIDGPRFLAEQEAFAELLQVSPRLPGGVRGSWMKSELPSRRSNFGNNRRYDQRSSRSAPRYQGRKKNW